MGSRLYPKFIDLVKNWPIDSTRKGRDLGERLRKLIAEEFPLGALSKVNEKKLSADLESLSRIAGNVHAQSYPRQFTTSTSTGLNKEELALLTSSEAYIILSQEIKSKSRLEGFKNAITKKKE